MESFRPVPKRKLKKLEEVAPVTTLRAVINPEKPMETHITALTETYGSGDLDTEAEIIAAINATNAALNDLFEKLEHYGIIRSS